MSADTDRGTALVIGESLIDVLPGGVERPGGSPMNVAVGLARLGHPVELATWFGAGDRGLVDHLASSGVTVVPGSDAAPRTSSATVSFDDHGTAHYVFDLLWEVPALPADLRPLVVHAGSIGTMLPPGAQDALAAIRALRECATVSYDPNVRPQIVGPVEQVRPLAEAFVGAADVVKVSDEDLAWLYPDVDPLSAAEAWAARGPALLVLTRGEHGVLAFTREGVLGRPAPRVAVADTVGAGDAFTAGLLHALWSDGLLGADRRAALTAIDRDALRRALDLASRVAGLTLSRPGADPPWASEL